MLRQTKISQSTRGIAVQRHICRGELACRATKSTNTSVENQSVTLSYSVNTETCFKANIKALFFNMDTICIQTCTLPALSKFYMSVRTQRDAMLCPLSLTMHLSKLLLCARRIQNPCLLLRGLLR